MYVMNFYYRSIISTFVSDNVNLKKMKKNAIHILSVFFLISCTVNQENSKNRENSMLNYRKSYSISGNNISIYSTAIPDTVDILLLSDTHLSIKDEREKPFEQYSERMSGAYKVTKHYRTGEETCPQQAFIETVNIAGEKNVDLLALTGDIFSYPSEAAVEWVDSILADSKLKYVYTTGNHDWHYEGMKGSSSELRSAWINERLLPLYKGNNPLFYFVDIKGVRVVMIDNSTYEISSDQLSFFRQQVKSGLPLILMMHIPLYAPDRPVSYGCAHPDWNMNNDNVFKIERREPWSEKGHTTETMQFREEVLNATNLLAVFSGHIHRQTLDVIDNLPLFVVKENASGNHYNIRVIPVSR